jgi:leucyl-tRNA synthetase
LILLLLAPYAPPRAEEMWRKLNHTDSLACVPWLAGKEPVKSVVVPGKLLGLMVK